MSGITIMLWATIPHEAPRNKTRILSTFVRTAAAASYTLFP